MNKKRIIHIIDDLGRGGAETMLVDLLQDLSVKYELTLITLRPKLEFKQEQIVCAKYISLNFYGPGDMPATVAKLNKIIKEINPDLVRCQLYWSTIVGRLACPKEIPFFFSVHATMNEDPIAFYKRYFLYILEKATYRPSQNMIGVTQAVIDSFKKVHPKHGKTFLLHNFVREQFFNTSYQPGFESGKTLRLVSVSNIRLIKNIPYLIEVMNLLKGQNVLLDIYGDGPLKNDVEALIKKYDLSNVQLKGKVIAIHEVLPRYDIFLSPSTVEGFGIAVAEAMSVGLPVIVSDIPVYKEICEDKAIYLDNTKPESLYHILIKILNGNLDLIKISSSNKEYARNRFSKQGYLVKLEAIYQTSFN